ncbi:MAG: hypothetical protein JW931_00310 [Methanomicrobiaceae archaeon]|nr:hypothetical protein [Methanomicrobiaceae archaeon]
MQKIQGALKYAAILLTLLLLAAGCISGESGQVEIIPENDYWSPPMSSAPGIGLSADYSGDGDVVYEWSADYGGFLLWTPEISQCSPPCITDKTVWWTYISEGEALPTDLPEEVRIGVKAIDALSGKTVAESGITLTRTEDGGYCTWARIY